MWIGLQRDTTETRQWWWADGVLGNNSNIGWAANEPSGVPNDYANINQNGTTSAAWQSAQLFGLCEKSLEAD